MKNNDEDKIDFDCDQCGRTFCTEDSEHKNAKDGDCGYCSVEELSPHQKEVDANYVKMFWATGAEAQTKLNIRILKRHKINPILKAIRMDILLRQLKSNVENRCELPDNYFIENTPSFMPAIT